ncbi:MAG: GDP-mannose 4,6-dehydratase [Solirubrobacterales bacterium]
MSESRSMLLIGAQGFLGAHLHSAVLASGMRVIAADRRAGGPEGRPCDLLDARSVAACVAAAKPDLIVNMAGSASVAESWRDPLASFALNATGVLHLLEAVAGHAPKAHVLCVSSAEVYGEPDRDRLPVTEDERPRPVTPYGAGKLAMEAICGQYARAGIRIATVRPFNQIGLGQAPSYAASGFARQIAQAEAAGLETVEISVGNLAAERDFTDVRDSARALAEISSRELCGVYNLCSGRPLGLETLISQMARATPLDLRPAVDPALKRPRDPAVIYGDPARLRGATGWEPRIPLERTIEDLLEWWRDQLGGSRGRRS